MLLLCFPWSNLHRTKQQRTLQRLIWQSKFVEWNLSRKTTPWDFKQSFTPRTWNTSHLRLPSLPRCLLDFFLNFVFVLSWSTNVRRLTTSLTTIVKVVLEFLPVLFWLQFVGLNSLLVFCRSFFYNYNSNYCRTLTIYIFRNLFIFLNLEPNHTIFLCFR